MPVDAVRERLRDRLRPSLDPRLARNHRALDAARQDTLIETLTREYFPDGDAYLSSEEGARDLRDHVSARLERFRTEIVPWLDSAVPLAGANVLEIGCGTGSSTVALGEQGARVIGIDILPGSLAVARGRCELYGVEAELLKGNAVEVDDLLGDRRFDLVIFFAALEHMTSDERLAAMRKTWDMLAPGSCWCLVDTPNRLWFVDGHTSHLPFFHWLPDDLALRYSRFSPRDFLQGRFDEPSPEAMLEFRRLGRGVSFHEFELTMGSADDLTVVSSLSSFFDDASVVRRWLRRVGRRQRYRSLIRRQRPRLHSGFFDESLDLILRK
jgi:2-polyprenyl-3-methyl-5-hydroxy-6-metoxy-1,4-benzoquinol methylase